MKWWKIENIYKNMYELDEKTQIYEFQFYVLGNFLNWLFHKSIFPKGLKP